jgi:hypothetical protein
MHILVVWKKKRSTYVHYEKGQCEVIIRLASFSSIYVLRTDIEHGQKPMK